MNRLALRKKSVVAALIVVALALTVGGWFARTPLLAWYAVRCLAQASEAERESCAARVVAYDQAAVSPLIGKLTDNEPRVCANVRFTLARLQQRWGWEAAATRDLSARLTGAFARLSPAGQEAVLRLKAEWIVPDQQGKAPPADVLDADSLLVREAVRSPGKNVRAAALQLALALLCTSNQPGLVEKWRDLAKLALRDADAEVRLYAIQLAQAPPIGLLEHVVPLMRDPLAEVRRAAILAVGPSQNAISSEDLLPWLHDPDPDVRRLCEVALRGRDVSDDNLRLGRLITDPRHEARLAAVEQLLADPQREPGQWLRRLSHDSSPSVRAAAIRAAALRPRVDLSDRIREMTQSDPSPTICQLAQFYLASQNRQSGSWPGD